MAATGLSFPCGPALAPGSAKEIAPGVLWLCLPMARAGVSVNAWALRDGQAWTVVDTGMDLEPVRHAWQAFAQRDGALEGLPIARLIGTHLHADHIGLAGWFEEQFAAPLWMTDAEYMQAALNLAEAESPVPGEMEGFYRAAGWKWPGQMPTRPGTNHMSPLPASYRQISDGEQLSIGGHDWEVVVGSGHSPEHACLYCAELGLFISGDQVLPEISSNVSVLPREPHANPLRGWLASLEKLRARVPAGVIVLPSHGAPFVGLHARLDALRDKRLSALARLHAALAAGPQRAVDVLPVLFHRDAFPNAFVLTLAVGEAMAYMNWLIARGEVFVQAEPGGVVQYRLAR